TMSALVLGLLIASAKGSFDTRSNQLVQASANIILLDRALAHYGPETAETRSFLRQEVTATVERFWPAEGVRRPIEADVSASPVELLAEKIQALSTRTEVQRELRSQALALATDVARTRLLLFEHLGASLPAAFSRGPGILALHHLRQLWPFCPKECDG